MKESFHNALKHANASKVIVHIFIGNDILHILIKDNGGGMKNQNQFGNGLKNMKKRMADIGVDFTIENKNGTLITIHRTVSTF